MIKSLIPTGSKILFAPLNWGLGHAVRSIPIIHTLINHGCQIGLASDGEPLKMLKEEFPELPSYELPAYNINYSYKSMAANMLFQLPKIYGAYKLENKKIEQLQKDNSWDIIISDGRYGVRSESTKNIFISHQLNIQSWNPMASAFANAVNANLSNQFDEVWVPDDADHKLSGKLSQSQKIKNVKYIGPKSRLRKMRLPNKYDLAVILSGPEPSRSKFENQLWEALSKSKLKIAWIRGTNTSWKKTNDRIEVFPRIGTELLNQIINSSGKVVCRSGYTSIMDLHHLNKNAVLIPTPGQTEQEYLGQWLEDNALFTVLKQKDIKQLVEILH